MFGLAPKTSFALSVLCFLAFFIMFIAGVAKMHHCIETASNNALAASNTYNTAKQNFAAASVAKLRDFAVSIVGGAGGAFDDTFNNKMSFPGLPEEITYTSQVHVAQFNHTFPLTLSLSPSKGGVAQQLALSGSNMRQVTRSFGCNVLPNNGGAACTQTALASYCESDMNAGGWVKNSKYSTTCVGSEADCGSCTFTQQLMQGCWTLSGNASAPANAQWSLPNQSISLCPPTSAALWSVGKASDDISNITITLLDANGPLVVVTSYLAATYGGDVCRDPRGDNAAGRRSACYVPASLKKDCLEKGSGTAMVVFGVLLCFIFGFACVKFYGEWKDDPASYGDAPSSWSGGVGGSSNGGAVSYGSNPHVQQV